MKKGDFRKILAGFFSIASCGYFGAVTFVHIPKENMGNANTILGFLLGTALGLVLSFYFGDSEGKEDGANISGG